MIKAEQVSYRSKQLMLLWWSLTGERL